VVKDEHMSDIETKIETQQPKDDIIKEAENFYDRIVELDMLEGQRIIEVQKGQNTQQLDEQINPLAKELYKDIPKLNRDVRLALDKMLSKNMEWSYYISKDPIDDVYGIGREVFVKEDKELNEKISFHEPKEDRERRDSGFIH
jgi:hypothetical protein